MADDEVSPEEFATWLKPHRALARVITVIDDREVAAEALISRLRGGFLRSAAGGWSSEERVRTWRKRPFVIIPAELWIAFNKARHGRVFWEIGDIRFSLGTSRAAYIPGVTTPPLAENFSDVRFDPKEVETFVINLPGNRVVPQAILSTETVSSPHDDNRSQGGPRVSEEHLRLWHDLYQRTYGGGPEDTLANALKSARGMFPGKSVARDRVRTLCAGRKAGRKSMPKSN